MAELLSYGPIPDLAEARARRVGYRQHPIDEAHPLYNEPLVDLATLGIDGLSHFTRHDNPPYHERFPGAVDRLYLRASVAAKLAEVDAALRRDRLKLFVHDAWRPTAVQAHGHDVWMPARLKQQQPSLEGEALLAEVERYWARPTTDPRSPSPHLTGGAVDLSLASTDSGQCLFMGSIFDDVTEIAHTDHYERHPIVSYSDEEARANRRRLYHAMCGAGFCNQPFEWWHYSWGDQMWARLTGQPVAFYGPAEPV
jgi:D-alanyl-D-alanine dipeptidase